jgi:hypothetical protein
LAIKNNFLGGFYGFHERFGPSRIFLFVVELHSYPVEICFLNPYIQSRYNEKGKRGVGGDALKVYCEHKVDMCPCGSFCDE